MGFVASTFRRAAGHAGERSKRRAALACLAISTLAAFGGAAAPTAGAAEGECPNEAIRVEQGSTHLPDCRAYELVNIPDKNQQLVSGGQLSPSGERIVYSIAGGIAQSVTGSGTFLAAERTASGWVSKPLTPPLGQAIKDYYALTFPNPGLTEFIAGAETGAGDAIGAPTLVRLRDDRSQTVLYEFQRPTTFGAQADVLASDDLSTVIGSSPENGEQILPEQPEEVTELYEFGSGTPRLVGRLPDGSIPACGLSPVDGYVNDNVGPTRSQHRISTDGRFTYFVTRGNKCTGPKQLYLLDTQSEETTLISGPVVSGPVLDVERFLQAAADGSWVIYRSEASYSPDDTNGTPDVYRYDSASHQNTCITCIAPGAQLVPAGYGSSIASNAAVSEDGSHVYFLATGQIGGKGQAGERNLYVWRAGPGGGSVGYVGAAAMITQDPTSGGEVTPDGNAFYFISSKTVLNGLSNTDNGGLNQGYLYDDRTETVACVSCSQDGSPTTGFLLDPGGSGFMSTNLTHVSQSSAITPDGRFAFFVTAQALAPNDVNQSKDVYEWHDGKQSLITDGTSVTTDAGKPELFDVSPDARDVVFTAIYPLNGEVRDQGTNLYDARIGGGFESPPRPPAPCEADACHGELVVAPPPPPFGTSSFIGSGNVRAQRHRGRHHHKRHHRHRGRHRHPNRPARNHG